MAKTILIVENLKDWESFYPVDLLLTPVDFLIDWQEKKIDPKERIKVINLCRTYKYLSNGYYCSLLSEARSYSVIPSVKTINDLSKSFFYHLDNDEQVDREIQKNLKDLPKNRPFHLKIFFGTTDNEIFQDLSRHIFDRFASPILEVEFRYHKSWEIFRISPVGLNSLNNQEQDRFAEALDDYSNKIWRKPKSKKKYRYDMAILHNPSEEMPPSDRIALQNFIKAGKQLDVLIELIEKKDFTRIAEFDALFIRETTSISNHTYRFSQKAESENLVVVDDPVSILRCTNKIFLENILKANKLHGPKTIIVSKDNINSIFDASSELGLPLVIKIPDGSFSKGVYKVDDYNKLKSLCEELFKKTSLLIFQEFFLTDFDWRIGIFNDRAIYACKYFMTKNHWQIYNHEKRNKKNQPAPGLCETLPISHVPKHVLSAALKVSRQMGKSLYGVDIKERDSKAYIIEVNDNPSIDSDVEDAILGEDLYYNIIQEFVRRIEIKN